MHSLFKTFKTDKSLEKNGIWLDYDDFKVKIGRAGGDNRAYLKAVDRKFSPHRRSIQSGFFSEEKAQKLLQEVYAETVILDFETKKDGKFVKGIPTESGEILPVNAGNVASLLEALPDFFKDIQVCAEQQANFRVEGLEKDVKN